MKLSLSLVSIFTIFSLSTASTNAAVFALTEGTYTQTFSSIGTALPAGWDIRTDATLSSLGTVASYTATAGTTTAWDNTGGGFKNFAAAVAGSVAIATTQTAATDRALGIRPSGSLGDPGASFNFNFSTVDQSVQSITIDLQMLSVQSRSTTWLVQYGTGISPTSFTTLGTYADPGVFGSTTLSIPTGTIGTALDGQANAWFRVVALSASTGANNRDSFAIDNFSITSVPEPAAAVIGSLGLLVLLRRRYF